MTSATENNQVVVRIATAETAMLEMMRFQLIPPATPLTAPAVPLEHATTEFVVVSGWQALGPLLGQGSAHAVSFISPKKTFCSAAGKH